jgi:hypothetical protein
MAYVTKGDYPTVTPSATIFLDGLLSLAFDGKRLCTLGSNNQAPPGQEHTLSVEVWQNPRPNPCAPISPNLPNGFREVEIRVNNPDRSILDGVYVYNGPKKSPSPGGNGDRSSFVDSVLDLEGPKFHRGPLQKNSSALRPRFYIDNGIFAASYVTQTKFQAVRHGSATDLDSIGSAIAADIYPDAGGSIDFIADGTRVLSLSALSLGPYEIVITNNCSRQDKCGYIFDHPRPDLRNDFYIHYRAIRLPVTEQFELRPKPNSLPNPTPAPLGTCHGAPVFTDPLVDSTPCAPVAYGLSGGLP